MPRARTGDRGLSRQASGRRTYGMHGVICRSLVQDLRREVRATRPHDGAEFGVDRDLAEALGVLQRLKHASASAEMRKVNVTH